MSVSVNDLLLVQLKMRGQPFRTQVLLHKSVLAVALLLYRSDGNGQKIATDSKPRLFRKSNTEEA
jgi:hypothetical protein